MTKEEATVFWMAIHEGVRLKKKEKALCQDLEKRNQAVSDAMDVRDKTYSELRKVRGFIDHLINFYDLPPLLDDPLNFEKKAGISHD